MADNERISNTWINGVGDNRLPNRTDLDDTNQGRKFRIPIGTPVFNEASLGSYDLLHTQVYKTGRGSVCDQAIKDGVTHPFTDPVNSAVLEEKTGGNQGQERT